MTATPPAVSSVMPLVSGTGAAKRWMSSQPVPSSLASSSTDDLVGITSAHALPAANAAVR